MDGQAVNRAPGAMRVAAWLWALSAVPGASVFVISSIAGGVVAFDGPPVFHAFTVVFLTVTVLVVWGLRVVCAVLLSGRRASSARAVLLVLGLLAGIGNDIVGAMRAAAAPAVVPLAGIDLVLIVAGTVAMYRPATNAFVRGGVVERGQRVQQYLASTHASPADPTPSSGAATAPPPIGVAPDEHWRSWR